MEEQFRLLIHIGTIARGNSIPAVRSLAVELGINSNTVARVYRNYQLSSSNNTSPRQRQI